jgi:hypothetical protein
MIIGCHNNPIRERQNSFHLLVVNILFTRQHSSFWIDVCNMSLDHINFIELLSCFMIGSLIQVPIDGKRYIFLEIETNRRQLRILCRKDNQQVGCSGNGMPYWRQDILIGQCYTFGPGDYELARFGLEQNVSSIKNPNDAYHITLFDKDKNFYQIDKDIPVLTAEWDNRADTIHIEKHRPTSCHPGADGIIAFINTDYSGGCLFITGNIPDLTPLNFDQVIVSIQFVGSYQNARQLVIYKQPGYKDECGAYWQNQSDLLHCARLALSIQLLPFTPPTPIPTVPGTHYAGNVAPQAILSPGSAPAVVDENLHTEWVGGHMVELDLRWTFPVTIHRVVVWDRKQSPSDNNQINKLKLSFSNGTSTGSIDMINQGPRCADVTFPAKTVTWLHLIAVDASGNNGYSEVEVWATTGPQYSNNTCPCPLTRLATVPAPACQVVLCKGARSLGETTSLAVAL